MASEVNRFDFIIAAQPNWYKACFVEGNGDPKGDFFTYDPIIAWGIKNAGVNYEGKEIDDEDWCYGHPITTETPTANEWLIKTPDGKFIEPFIREYINELEALNGMRASANRKIEAQKIREAKQAQKNKQLTA